MEAIGLPEKEKGEENELRLLHASAPGGRKENRIGRPSFFWRRGKQSNPSPQWQTLTDNAPSGLLGVFGQAQIGNCILIP